VWFFYTNTEVEVACEETSSTGFNVLKNLMVNNGQFNSLAVKNAYVNKQETFSIAITFH